MFSLLTNVLQNVKYYHFVFVWSSLGKALVDVQKYYKIGIATHLKRQQKGKQKTNLRCY